MFKLATIYLQYMVISGDLLQGGGGLAEYAIAPISTTIKRRHEVTPVQGSAMGVSGFAALQSVRNSGGIDIEGRSTEKKNLLIRAASGGVGTLAVQVSLFSKLSEQEPRR